MVVIFAAAALCMIVERLMPARPLPPSPGWWLRVVALNVVQFLVVVGIGTHFDGWFRARAPLPLPTMHPAAATAIAYAAVTFHSSIDSWRARCCCGTSSIKSITARSASRR